MENVRKAHAWADQMMARAQTQREARPISCAKGCFHCCKEPLLVDADEAIHALEIVPAEKREQVCNATLRWVENVSDSGLLDQPVPHVLEWRQRNLWCPLLDTDGTCLVYDNRPYSCRAHNAVGDPVLCADDHARLRQKYAYLPEIDAAMLPTTHPKLEAPVTLDHLGVFLAEFLSGVKLESTARITLHRDGAGIVMEKYEPDP